MPHEIAPGVLSWASELDKATLEQAERTARLPIVASPFALMPDAHLGMGATIGSVIATETAVIPSAVGVDIGCGMAARRLDLRVDQLPDRGLDGWVDRMRRSVPRDSDTGTASRLGDALEWFAGTCAAGDPDPPRPSGGSARHVGLGQPLRRAGGRRAGRRLDPAALRVAWGGNQLATLHTKKVARRLHEGLGTRLEDRSWPGSSRAHRVRHLHPRSGVVPAVRA